MTESEANNTFGCIVFQNDYAIVRCKACDLDKRGEEGKSLNGIEVVVHNKIDGKEQLPRGYLLGINMLNWEALQ